MDLIDEYKSQCRELLDMWADVQNADALLIRDGGQEATVVLERVSTWILRNQQYYLHKISPLQAPFNATHFSTAMASDRVERKAYKCGQNWWRHNLVWSACPGAPQLSYTFLLGCPLYKSKYQRFLSEVLTSNQMHIFSWIVLAKTPVRATAVDKIMRFHFEKPAPYPLTLKVWVPSLGIILSY